MDSRKDPHLRAELAQMRREIEKLKSERLLQGDEVRSLKVEIRAYQDEIKSLNDKIQSLEDRAIQDSPALDIGKEVRLRYLERHRQRMGRGIGKTGFERIKRGDRAAHRGRPVVDALLCLTGEITDREVYPDLYGVTPEAMKEMKDIPEVVEVTGFRASLQSEGRVTREFQTLFERSQERARTYTSPMALKAAFKEDKILQQLHTDLQFCYDKIVAANLRGQQNLSS